MANQLNLTGGNQAPSPFTYQAPAANEMYGPFTGALAPQQPQQPQVMPSGYGGAKEALAMFASRFLEGAQAARRKKFEESEQQKMEHAKNFDSVLEHIQNGPYTAEAKQQAFDAWAKIRYGDIQNQMGGGGKGSKGGKGGKQDHQNPLLHFAHGVVSSVLGPVQNEKHADFGPEAVNTLLNIANNPQNQINIPKMLEDTTSALSSAIQGAQEAAQKAGVTLDRGTLLAMPSVQKQLNQFSANNMDWRQFPQLSSLIESVPAKLSPTEQAELDRDKAQTDLAKAQQRDITQRTETREPMTVYKSGKNGPEVVTTVDQDAQGRLYKKGTNDIYALPEGHAVGPANATYFTSQMTARSSEQRMLNQKEIAELQTRSREYVARFNQGRIDQRQYRGDNFKQDNAIVKTWDDLLKQRSQLAGKTTRNAQDRQRIQEQIKDLDDRIAALSQPAQDALGRLQTTITPETAPPPTTPKPETPKPTAAPPTPQKKEPQKAAGVMGTGHENVDSLIQDLLKPAGATAAPPR